MPSHWKIPDSDEGHHDENLYVVGIARVGLEPISISELRSHDLIGLQKAVDRIEAVGTRPVPVAQVTHSAQAHLYPEILDWYLDDQPGPHPFGDDSTSPIVLAEVEGRGTTVIDGNHRLASAKMRGEESVEAIWVERIESVWQEVPA